MSITELLQGDSTEQRRLMSSVVTGIVTNNQDPEKLGRIKVKMPWRGKDQEEESGWAKVVGLMGGKEMGTVFYPEVGDEVVVAFGHGDINHPFIIGSVWNKPNPPPETNEDGKNNIRIMKSRSGHQFIFDDNMDDQKAKVEVKTQGGHSFVLDDTDSSGKVEITTTSGHVLTLDDASGAEMIKIADNSGSNMITIDTSNNSIKIESGQDITISASSGKVAIEAKDFEVKASASAKIEASSGMDLKAGGQMNVKGATINLN